MLKTGTQIVGRFEIVAPLGAGSMGEVYQAHDLKLHRDVALKVLSPALALSDEHLHRFEREARAASALNHPNICTIYDIGQAPEADGRPYLVMELLRGQTLFELLAAGPLSLSTVIGLGVQVADALEAAHSAGIIHRDIKPANIFVTGRGEAKLLDFGLAAIVQAEAGSSGPAILTNPGTAVGTVMYMSPEQALGDPLDRRTDIFSFGVVLYEMVTGRRAFDARSTTAIVDAILHATPPDLDSAAPSRIPKDLRRLLARMLDKAREGRPASAAEVASHLRAVQSGSIAGREYAAAFETRSQSGARLGGTGPDEGGRGAAPGSGASSGLTQAFAAMTFANVGKVVVALLVLVLAAYGVYTRSRAGATPAPREPLLLADFANTTGEPVFDGALQDALEIQLQQSPYLNVLPGSQVRAALQLMERPPGTAVTPAVAQELCQRLGVKASLLGSIAPLGGAYVIKLEAQACGNGDVVAREQVQAASKTDVLASVGAAAARLRERLGESLGSIQRFNVPVQNATTSSLEALKAYSMGIETRARIGDVQAIPLFEHALELDPNFAVASARLATIYTNLGDLGRAQDYMKRAFARADSLSEPERLFIRSSYHYIVTGRLDEVVATYRLWISTYPHDWIPHSNLSSTYYRLNQFDDALQEAQAAVRLEPNVVVPYQQLARTLLALDRFADCKAVIAEASARSLDSSFNRAIAFDLAFLDNDTGRMQEQLQAAAPRADSYLVAAEAARAALATGQVETSRTLYAQAISGARGARIADVAGSLIAEQALGDALVGDRTRAHDELEQALATSDGIETTRTAALAAAFSGRPAQAAQLATVYARAAPRAPDTVAADVPLLSAAVALARDSARDVPALLNGATRFERSTGPWLPYVRGLAYAALNDPGRAAAEFRGVIAHRGNQPTSLLRVLARLHVARAERAANDVAHARQAYADFAAVWRNADPRHPLLAAAGREAAELTSAPSPPRR